MITFKQFLKESLNSSFTWHKKEWNAYDARFMFLDNEFQMFSAHFLVDEDDIDGRVLYISFEIHADGGKTMALQGNIRNPLKVYSTIGNALQKYIEDYPVDRIEYTPVVDRTSNLYTAFGKKIAAMLDGKLVVYGGGVRIQLKRHY